MNKYFVLYCLAALLLFTSCASTKGISRIRRYDFPHQDIPAAFDGYRIAFISDLHYKSLFTEKRLDKLVKTLNKQHADVLLMGGDYHAGCHYVAELFEQLSRVTVPDGIWAVLGNHDYKACYEEIIAEMQRHNIRLLEHTVDTIRRNGDEIILAGVRDPFDLERNGESPSAQLSSGDFVLLLVHTPDYAETVSVENADLVLSGHTHGGQVTLLGIYAPVLPSRYGQRFRTGLRQTSKGIPVIVTNGVGTSRKKIRMFAPSEIMLITLKQASHVSLQKLPN